MTFILNNVWLISCTYKPCMAIFQHIWFFRGNLEGPVRHEIHCVKPKGSNAHFNHLDCSSRNVLRVRCFLTNNASIALLAQGLSLLNVFCFPEQPVQLTCCFSEAEQESVLMRVNSKVLPRHNLPNQVVPVGTQSLISSIIAKLGGKATDEWNQKMPAY